jgi:hypothetical protein
MTPRITQAEIEKLIKIFEEKVGRYSVVFNKDENDEYDFKIYNGESGADAYWSGSIILEQDYFVEWEFSLVNGVDIKNATFNINESNKNICENIFDVYNIWYNQISKFIRSDAEAPSMNSGEEVVQGGGEEEMSLSESRTIKGRKTLIDSSSDRMKRLAGI